jgi:hypothetical protein
VNEIYLKKVVGFFPHLRFSEDKSRVLLCLLFMLPLEDESVKRDFWLEYSPSKRENIMMRHLLQ